MSLKTFVKINRVTNLTDARFCAGMNADLLGFSLENDSTQFLSPKHFEEITGWISGIEYAGEFKHSSAEAIKATLEQYPGITWIESEQLEPLLEFHGTGLRLIYKKNIEEVAKLETELGKVLKDNSIILHLTSNQDTLTPEFLNIINSYSSYCNILVGFGISPSNVEDLTENKSIYGVALDSGDEIKPGLRDFDQLAEILEKLEIED